MMSFRLFPRELLTIIVSYSHFTVSLDAEEAMKVEWNAGKNVEVHQLVLIDDDRLATLQMNWSERSYQVSIWRLSGGKQKEMKCIKA